MASRGITVNVVAPGVIAGRMADAAFPPDVVKQIVPAGRAGTPDEIAAVVRFLCSDAASYVTGQVIGANGGMGSEEHTSELQSLMRISYAVFCLTKKNIPKTHNRTQSQIKKDTK